MTLNLRSEWDDRIVRLGYPSARYRWCTTRKVNAINRETKNSVVAIGIAYDERERMFVSPNKARTFVFPLVEMQMTEQDCLNYCYSLGFDFYGLYKIRDRVSCYCCPFISDNEVLNMPKDLEDNIIKFENICHHYKHQRWKIFFTESFTERTNRLLEERKK